MNSSIFISLIVLLLPAFGKCGVRDWLVTPTETEEVVEEKWRHLERETRTIVKGMMKDLIPFVVRLNAELDISQPCQQSILKLISGVKDFKEWAIRMVDATGKLEGGHLSGTFSALGSYDGCLDIIEPADSGSNANIHKAKYCVIDFRPPLPPKPKLFISSKVTVLKDYNSSMEIIENMKRFLPLFYSVGFKLGVCLPSRCNKDDLQQVARVVTDRLGILTRVRSCEIREDQIHLDSVQWAIILVLAVFFFLVTTASTAHYLLFYEEDKNPSSSVKLFQAFSIFSNIRRLLDTSSEESVDRPLSCLHGLRFFSMIWVLLIHTIIFSDINLQRNAFLKDGMLSWYTVQFIANGSLAVDSFLFITSVLVAHLLMSKCSQLKLIYVPVVIFHRIWRLLPSAMLCTGLAILMPALGSGPNWTEHFQDVANNCRNNWWRLTLFINNFEDAFEMCLVHTWYISLDLQYFLVALTFIFTYFRNPHLGNTFLGALLVGTTVFTILIVGFMELLPTPLFAVQDVEVLRKTLRYVYMLPTNHLGVYVLGLAVGTYLAKKENLVMPWWLRLIGWVTAIACNTIALFTTVVWNSGYMHPIGWGPALYSGLHRPLWALGLAWLTINCSQGYGGLINSILSWKGYLPLNKLSYLVYLLHLLVIYYYQASLRGTVDTTMISVVYLFCGIASISFCIALIAKLLFEYPLILLEYQFFEYIQLTPNKLQEKPKDDTKKDNVEKPMNGK